MIARRPSGFVQPCQPSKVARPPSGPLWVHEIKHDGYRMLAVPSRVSQRLPHLTARDVAEIDAELRTVPTEIGGVPVIGGYRRSSAFSCLN
jgi:ATP-dependent DNA ligase